MRLQNIILTILSGSLAAPATETDLEKRSSFPIPYIGESLKDYVQQLIGWIVQLPLITDVNSFDTLVKALPTPDVNWNLDFLYHTSKTDDMPGYNKDFDPVDGISSGSVRWLVEADGRTEDDPVILYFHGGGYVIGMVPPFAAFWQDVWKDFNTKSDRLSILLVDYAVSPNEGVWSKQLQQAAAVYNKLSESSNNIILAGDSAGAHLSLSLSRHVKYPWGDGVPQVASKPQGLITISPWVNIYPNQGNGTKNGTYATYEGTDILSADILSAMGNISVPDEVTRTSSQMNFWKDFIDWSEVLPDYGNIFVSYGDQEVLKGDIETWLNIAKVEDSNATIYRDLSGCSNCQLASGTHDNVIISAKNSAGYPKLVDFLVSKFS